MNTFRIIGLMALTLVSIVPAMKPAPPTLISNLHASPIPLQVFDVTMFTPTRAFVWNFTVDFANKDVGSDSFELVVDAVEVGTTRTTFVYLFSDQNLTDWLSAPVALHSGQRLAYWASSSPIICDGTGSCGSADGFHFAPPAAGLYHIAIVNQNALQNLVPGVQSTYHVEIHGHETWTTTTIG